MLDEVSKRFRKHGVKRHNYTTFKSALLGKFFSPLNTEGQYLNALSGFSLNLPPGSSVGVIGRNGSGKSTLLKLVAGIYHPDSGKVSVSGRVSALIELGAGFHPEFTGRENIYLGGAMFGLSKKEVDARFDKIVRYAELEDSIDDPIRTYSSGMYMRLGFSVAIFTDPDILLIDEVLAVGDAQFIHRCYDSVSEMKRRGKTLLLVTHDLDSVARWCDEAIWLEKGKIRLRGEPQWVIDSYLEQVMNAEEKNLEGENKALAISDDPEEVTEEATEIEEGAAAATTSDDLRRWGSKQVELTGVRFKNARCEERWIFTSEETLHVEVDYCIHETPADLVFGIAIVRADGLVVHGTNTDIDSFPLPAYSAGESGTFIFTITRLGLLEGSYFVDVAAHRSDGTPFDYHHLVHKFSVRGSARIHGVYNPTHSWEILETEMRLVSQALKR